MKNNTIIFLSLFFITSWFGSFLKAENIVKNDIFSYAEICQEPTIKVFLDEIDESSPPIVEVKGSYSVYNSYNKSRLSSGIIGKNFIVQVTEDGMKWGESYPDVSQIAIVPDEPSTSIWVNGIQYKGALFFYNLQGTIKVINDLKIDDYIDAIISMQIDSPFEKAALESLVIVNRSNAYYQTQAHQEMIWHTKASYHHYIGNGVTMRGWGIEEAIAATEDLILIIPENGRMLSFAAEWTINCAGKTAPYHAIYRTSDRALDVSVTSSYAQIDRDSSRWQSQIDLNELFKLIEMPNITHVSLFKDKVSGKVYGFKFSDSKMAKNIDFITLQKALGRELLPSNDLANIRIENNQIRLTGYGQGTGVGLCLYSADKMAKEGKLPHEILALFFPNAYVDRISRSNEAKENLRDYDMLVHVEQAQKRS